MAGEGQKNKNDHNVQNVQKWSKCPKNQNVKNCRLGQADQNGQKVRTDLNGEIGRINGLKDKFGKNADTAL